MSELNDAILERAVGAVCAGAAGDALGAGYEFTNPHPDDEITMKGGGAFGWASGEWTDDTAMAIGILDAIAEKECQIEAIGNNFLRWYASSPPDVGIQTSAVLSSASNGSDLTSVSREFHKLNPDSCGNGALMRTGPVALSALGNRETVASNAAAVASLTHAHPDSVSACILWSLAIQDAIISAPTQAKAYDWEDSLKRGLPFLDTNMATRWEQFIDEAITGPSVLFNPNGYAVTAFQAALSVIVETPVPPDCPEKHLAHSLEAAVRVGDDCDTVAAIAGALLGARWGDQAIPNDWKHLIHGSRTNGTEKINYTELQRLARKCVSR